MVNDPQGVAGGPPTPPPTPPPPGRHRQHRPAVRPPSPWTPPPPTPVHGPSATIDTATRGHASGQFAGSFGGSGPGPSPAAAPPPWAPPTRRPAGVHRTLASGPGPRVASRASPRHRRPPPTVASRPGGPGRPARAPSAADPGAARRPLPFGPPRHATRPRRRRGGQRARGRGDRRIGRGDRRSRHLRRPPSGASQLAGTRLDIQSLLRKAQPSVVSIQTGESSSTGVFGSAGSGRDHLRGRPRADQRPRRGRGHDAWT